MAETHGAVRAVPNMLSMVRLLLAVAFPFLPPAWRLPAVLAGGISDGLDGFIARRFGATSALGGLLDAIADKSFVLSVLLTLASSGEIDWWQVAPIVARDAAVAYAAAYSALRRRWRDFLRMSPRVAGKLTTLFVFAWFVVVLAGAPRAVTVAGFVLAAAASTFAAIDYLVQMVREVRARRPQATGSGVSHGVLLCAFVMLLGGCTAPEATSLLGRKLYAPPLEPDVRAKREADLAAAKAAWEAAPDDEEATIWYGRRMAYLGRYREAIEIFGIGLTEHPRSSKLLRHRGHRFITVRDFDRAIRDLERAARLIEGAPDEVEPDGMPNARNVPTSTAHTNIWYHLGLARYLMGDWTRAAEAYRRCAALAANDDMRCASAYWLYLSLRRAGRPDEAAAVLETISPEMEIIENIAYHELLLVYKGARDAKSVAARDASGAQTMDAATIGYGLGAWLLLAGDEAGADSVFREVIAGEMWPAFGHIAAEADLARTRKTGAAPVSRPLETGAAPVSGGLGAGYGDPACRTSR